MNAINYSEMGRKGGSAKSDKKTFASLLKGSQRAMCKRCDVDCYLKEDLLKNNPQSVCQVPFSRARALATGTPIIPYHPEVLEQYIFDILDFYQERTIQEPTIKRMQELAALVLKTKQVFFPAVQKSIAVNINTFQEQLDNWRKVRTQLYIEHDTSTTTK